MATTAILWAEPVSFSVLNGAAAQNTEGIIDLGGRYGSVSLQVSGTFTATVSFKATVDGTNWVDIQGTNVSSGSSATSTSAAGIFVFKTIGIAKLKAVVSAYTSGSVTAKALASPLV